MECVVYAEGKGFFESLGWNGLTFVKDYVKAFVFPNKRAAKDVCEAIKQPTAILGILD